MKKFRQFIQEDSYSDKTIETMNDVSLGYVPFSDPDNKSLFKELSKYKKKVLLGLQQTTRIHRGMQSTAPYYIADIRHTRRRAANTSNTTNLLVSEILPSWKPFPPRNQSFICSLDSDLAAGYGSLFIAIPLTDLRVGVCSTADFWDTFQRSLEHKLGIGDVPAFNRVLERIFNIESVDRTDKEALVNRLNSSYSKPVFQKYSKELEEIITIVEPSIIKSHYTGYEHMDWGWQQKYFKQLNKFETYDTFNYILGYITPKALKTFIDEILKHNNIISFLNELLKPENNNIRLVNYANLSDDFIGDREVWITGKVLFIRSDMYNEFNRKFIKKYGNKNETI